MKARFAHRTTPLVTAAALLLSACSDGGTCPLGSIKVGDTCVKEQPDAALAADAAAADEPDAAEADAECAADTCGPAAPDIRGAASMAPGRVSWTWSTPDGAARFELQLDGKPVTPTPLGARYSPSLPEGDHDLEVRACTADGACSPWATHHTVVEGFGQDLPSGLTDSARSFERTALGHRVALGCEGCVADVSADASSAEEGVLSVERALQRGADVVQLGVAGIEGQLVVSSADAQAVDTRTTLPTVLGRGALRTSDAIVLLDLVENEPRQGGSVTPAAFAEAILDALSDAPDLVKNGRPLLLRSTVGNRRYLEAVHSAAAGLPEIGPYIRYVLRDPGDDVAAFYDPTAPSPDAPLVANDELVDAVSIDFALPNLPYRIERSRQAGRAVIIDHVPVANKHGHALIASLREHADVILTRYRVDQARAIVSAADTDLYFGPEGMAPDGSHITLAYTRARVGKATLDYTLEKRSPPLRPKPSLLTSPLGAALLPPALAFGVAGQFSIDGQITADPSLGGDLLAAFGRFGAGFQLRTGRVIVFEMQGGVAVFSFTAGQAQRVFTAAQVQAACGQPLLSLLDPQASHWLVAYSESKLWTIIVDGSCVLSALDLPPSVEPVAGATYEAEAPDGALQSISYLRFPPGRVTDGTN